MVFAHHEAGLVGDWLKLPLGVKVKQLRTLVKREVKRKGARKADRKEATSKAAPKAIPKATRGTARKPVRSGIPLADIIADGLMGVHP